MARARNIKHSFFMNEALADCEPLARILFIGLWTIADFKGNLEYKPRKIKAQLLPYDNVEIDSLVSALDKSRLITIYSNGDLQYININKFVKHQNPHKNEKEKGSDVPTIEECKALAVDSIDDKGESRLIAINPDKNPSDPASSCSLIPDSCSLIPKEKKAPRNKFIPPSLEELSKFITEKKLTFDPQVFLDHFYSNGWKVGGKAAMKDWQASARNWNRRQSDFKRKPDKHSGFKDRDYSEGETKTKDLSWMQ
jgi:hypothetical protein